MTLKTSSQPQERVVSLISTISLFIQQYKFKSKWDEGKSQNFKLFKVASC